MAVAKTIVTIKEIHNVVRQIVDRFHPLRTDAASIRIEIGNQVEINLT